MGIRHVVRGAIIPAAAALLAGLAASPASAQSFLDNIQPGGFYAGGQVGVVNGQGHIDIYDSGSMEGSWPIQGFFAGGFAGYDWFYGDILFGIEADLNVSNAGGAGSGSGSILYNYGTDLHAFGSIRKRLGMVFDNWTFFGTAGLAFAHSTFWSEDCPDGCYPQEDQPLSQFGFTGGLGVQYAINEMVSIRGTVNHFWFRPVEVDLGEGGSPSPYPSPVDTSFTTASIGVLVKLN